MTDGEYFARGLNPRNVAHAFDDLEQLVVGHLPGRVLLGSLGRFFF